MKKALLPVFVLLSFLLSSCELAGDIFKGGVWTGVILVVLVLGIIIYFFTRRQGK